MEIPDFENTLRIGTFIDDVDAYSSQRRCKQNKQCDYFLKRTNFKFHKLSGMVSIGIVAPAFSLFATPDQKISLSEFRGKRVILAFYPADWSPVCGDQMALYNEMLKYFQKLNAEVIGISVDGKWCHLAFSQDRKLHFPLLADFEPKGAVAKMYGVYDDEVGECKRALFVLDEEGIIRWNYLSPVGINPGADGILNALEEMGKVKNIVIT